MSLQIVPLNCGYLTEVERSAHQYFTGFGEKVCAQSVLWLIKGGEFPIVVDVGSGTTELVSERFGRELIQEPGQMPRDAVAAAGVDPDDVRAVVQTHLHWDHALGLELILFPNAKVYIQRREIQYAAAPYPMHRGLYDPQVIRKLLPTHASEYPNITVIDGDRTLTDGVRILLTPGHTPGTQALVVDTGETTYAIASDNVPWETSWQGPDETDWIPSGIHVSLEDCYRSIARLSDVADVVLPSHDACVFEQGPFPAHA
jgi:N-acyl homoserine lactone hydrolase